MQHSAAALQKPYVNDENDDDCWKGENEDGCLVMMKMIITAVLTRKMIMVTI